MLQNRSIEVLHLLASNARDQLDAFQEEINVADELALLFSDVEDDLCNFASNPRFKESATKLKLTFDEIQTQSHDIWLPHSLINNKLWEIIRASSCDCLRSIELTPRLSNFRDYFEYHKV